MPFTPPRVRWWGTERSFRASIELRAVTGLARLLGRTGDAAHGERLLTGVYRSFTEGLETTDLREASATLDALRRMHRGSA